MPYMSDIDQVHEYQENWRAEPLHVLICYRSENKKLDQEVIQVSFTSFRWQSIKFASSHGTYLSYWCSIQSYSRKP